MKTGQVDALVETNVFGFQLEQRHVGRLLGPASDYVKHFVSNAIFASNEIIGKNPDLVKRFLAGWFKSVAFMSQHKNETVQVVSKLAEYDEAVQERNYDATMPLLSRDGRFSPEGLEALADSFTQLGILGAKPDMSTLYTDAFLPR